MNNVDINRTEQKYVLDLPAYYRLRRELAIALRPDTQALAPRYPVRSLYFDTLDERDFADKLGGVEQRQKVRLRTYDPASGRCKLEIKAKTGEHQHKSSFWLDQAEAQALTRGQLEVLHPYLADQPLLTALYADWRVHHYRPVVLTEYQREAFTHPWGDTRLTLDTRLQASESCFDLFAPRPIYTAIYHHQAVLEVKSSREPLGFLGQLLSRYHLEPLAVSKYCLSRVNFYQVAAWS